PLLAAGLALDHRRLEGSTQLVQLVDVGTDDEYLLVGVLFHQRAYRSGLGVGGGTKTVTVLGFGGGVGQPLGLRQVHADLHAVGWGDTPLVLHVFLGIVVE